MRAVTAPPAVTVPVEVRTPASLSVIPQTDKDRLKMPVPEIVPPLVKDGTEGATVEFTVRVADQVLVVLLPVMFWQFTVPPPVPPPV
jgi:hypothetical protein